LRKELEMEGVQFKSHSDTEVLLQLYARYGADCLSLLRGMFAFAVRDNQNGKLFLARDPLGIKPLYYFRTDKLFVFASELRALLASELMPRRLNPAGLTSYLQNGSVSSPETIVEGIRLLQPGHFITVEHEENGNLTIKETSYVGAWLENAKAPKGLDRDAAVEALRETLKESVRVHLESDVPLGPFLSGGIDSSAIVALMGQVTNARPKTFSVVFEEERFSEAEHARHVATRFGTEHHEIHLGEDQLFDMLPSAIAAEDQPTMDGINTFVVSKAVKEAGITVALSGLGGDELFAGYPAFRRALRLQSAARLPAGLRQGVSSLGQRFWNGSVQQQKLWQLLRSDGSPNAACTVSRQLLSVEEVETLLSFPPATENGEPPRNGIDNVINQGDVINAVSRWELNGYMSNTLLRDTDFMSMAHSLEVRVPCVDAEVVNFVLGLPGEWKLNGGRQKPLLQDALGDLLPSEVMNRRKMGFTLPLVDWMQSRLRNEIETTFANGSHFKAIGLQPDSVRRVWRQFLQAPQRVGWSRPWALYVLGRWCEQHQVSL
ncbi:MAG TPA: asparagine synthase (glutamine-hydrolyzing), partial [Pyrinomonadaceae bacterium]|nr:asparagine synthase (glutamine-hydrolyzing) [Pyrinomonadaceae bacterium]